MASLSVGYICDRTKCENCSPECRYTFDHNYAKHKGSIPDISKTFVITTNGQDMSIWEKEDKED